MFHRIASTYKKLQSCLLEWSIPWRSHSTVYWSSRPHVPCPGRTPETEIVTILHILVQHRAGVSVTAITFKHPAFHVLFHCFVGCLRDPDSWLFHYLDWWHFHSWMNFIYYQFSSSPYHCICLCPCQCEYNICSMYSADRPIGHKSMVSQDRWSLMAVVSQDKFHCICVQ